MSIQLREQWLHKVATSMRAEFKERTGLELPPYRLTCGFPSRGGELGKKTRTRGQCWAAVASADAHAEIFISPVEDDAYTVAAILAHELIHAALPEAAHGPLFQKAAKSLGHMKPFTSSVPTPEFDWIKPHLAKAGAYPHARLNALSHVGAKKKQGTRMLKCVCPECGYTVRTTATWLDKGRPVCPVDAMPMEPEETEQ